MSPKPFAVRIFLQDGTVDGVKFVAKSKWIGRGIVIPRALLGDELERTELNSSGVYLLVGAEEEGRQSISIGSAAPLAERLRDEAAKSDFWSWVLISNAKKGALSLDTIQYLEVRLLQMARQSCHLQLVHSRDIALPKLDQHEQDAAEEYLQHLLCICPVVGLRGFISL
jgi:hypothetical protein